ncbi:MAG: MFS transporter [Thermodesulfobacteriota bacterium]|nr:MAG: MFS transporter [Thermodesulfobacteriota bacterium]
MPIRGDSRVIFGWAMYDWANSAYITTLAVAILPIYFAGVVVPPDGLEIRGTLYAAETLWGFMVSAAAFLVFIAAPTLGAIADFCCAKKRFLFFFCYLGVVSAAFLSFSKTGDVWLTMILFVISQIGFVGANVFYDAFLPQIAPEGKTDRISSKGFAYGYVGGGLQFALALGLLAGHEKIGLSEAEAARLGMLTAALWWGGFALVTVSLLREPRRMQALPEGFRRVPLCQGYISLGISRVWKTIRKLRKLRHLVLFLAAFLVYNEGIQTVIQMATIYGKQELHLTTTTLMMTLLLVQAVAFLGALLSAWISERIGAKRAVIVTLTGWSGVVIYAYFIHSATEYFVMGGIVGLVLGGSQAISRSFYASIIPEGASAEFFGFYSVVSKFSAVWGPFIFAIIRHWTGSSRNSILSLIFFFILGIILLSRVNEKEARKAGAELEL